MNQYFVGELWRDCDSELATDLPPSDLEGGIDPQVLAGDAIVNVITLGEARNESYEETLAETPDTEALNG